MVALPEEKTYSTASATGSRHAPFTSKDPLLCPIREVRTDICLAP